MNGLRSRISVGLALALLAAPTLAQTPPAPPASAPAPFSWPASMSNAQVLPAETGGERLQQIMVSFSRALGVRCSHCHVGATGAPLNEMDFVSDANPNKGVTRAMMRMTWQINNELLPRIPDVQQRQISCYSCHRGATTPDLRPPAPPAG
jgi:hypothetical protein